MVRLLRSCQASTSSGATETTVRGQSASTSMSCVARSSSMTPWRAHRGETPRRPRCGSSTAAVQTPRRLGRVRRRRWLDHLPCVRGCPHRRKGRGRTGSAQLSRGYVPRRGPRRRADPGPLRTGAPTVPPHAMLFACFVVSYARIVKLVQVSVADHNFMLPLR